MASILSRFRRGFNLWTLFRTRNVRLISSDERNSKMPSPVDVVDGVRRMERIFRDMVYNFGSRSWPFNTNWWTGTSTTPGSHWTSEDVYIDENGQKIWRLTMDMSCFKPQDIDIKTRDRQLIVKAKHHSISEDKGNTKYDFEREQTLPGGVVDVSSLRSKYTSDGRLIIEANYVDDKSRTDEGEHVIPVKHTTETKSQF